MSHKFSRPSKDANHNQIRDTLLAHGYSVGDMAAVGGSFPDFIVSDEPPVTVIMEAKTKTGFFRLGQLRFLANWKGYVAFVETPEEALNVMYAPELLCLSRREKLAIQQLVYRYDIQRQQKNIKDMQIKVRRFEKDLAEILKT